MTENRENRVIKKIDIFDVKVTDIPNELEKYMASTINTNVGFIDN